MNNIRVDDDISENIKQYLKDNLSIDVCVEKGYLDMKGYAQISLILDQEVISEAFFDL